MGLAQKIIVQIDGKSTVAGQDVGDFLDMNLQQSLLGHHSLEIVYRRDAFEKEDGIILDKSDKLFLGTKIYVSIEVKDGEKMEFNGIVTGLRASKMNDAQSDTLILEAASPDFLLDDGEHCRTFGDMRLQGIVDKILGEYPIDSTKIQPEHASQQLAYTVQYKESAYDFLARLASKKAQWFYFDGTDLVFGARKKKTVELEFGADLFTFDYSLELEDLKFKYLSYDYYKNETISSDSGDKKISNLSDKAKSAYDISEKKFKHETQSLYNHSLKKDQAQEHLDNRVKLIKSAIASGLVSCSGSSDNAALLLGAEINITENIKEGKEKKQAKHGKYIVTSLSHSCDRNGNYQNSFTAVPAELEVPPYASPHAVPFSETQIAKVMDNNDPDKLGRVRVQFLWQEEEGTMTPWLRIVSPHTGDAKGFYFIPEIDEQVMVAFEGGNAEKPYIIGSMYHGKAKPDDAWVNQDDDIKAIRTRSGHTIEFCDKDGGEEIKIYDKDKDNYVITLSSHSSMIKIESKGDIEMEAQGDLKVKANNIEMKANADLKLNATNTKVDSTSQCDLSAMNINNKASAQLKLEASAMIEQKAGIIKIN